MVLCRVAIALAGALFVSSLGPPLGLAPAAFHPPVPQAAKAAGPRVVAIGDVHGAFDQFVEILQTAGLVDAKRQWIGGTTVLVQTGDIFDRGPKVREALDLLMRLEEEARRAGGRVEALLGNHEVMNLLHEFRDVSPASYAAFADARSESRRQRAFDDYAKLVKERATAGEAPSRDAWLASHPPGFLEYVEALGPRGKYGRWLRSHKVVTTEGGTAFMHAGVRADMAATFDDINRTATREIAAWDDTKALMVKAQIVPAFCTLPEAVEAAVAELQRIAAALQTNPNVQPGDHVTREFVEKLQALLAVGKSSLFEPEGPLWFRGFATLAREPGNHRHAADPGPDEIRSGALRDRAHALEHGTDRVAILQPADPDRHRDAHDILQEWPSLRPRTAERAHHGYLYGHPDTDRGRRLVWPSPRLQAPNTFRR